MRHVPENAKSLAKNILDTVCLEGIDKLTFRDELKAICNSEPEIIPDSLTPYERQEFINDLDAYEKLLLRQQEYRALLSGLDLIAVGKQAHLNEEQKQALTKAEDLLELMAIDSDELAAMSKKK